MIFYIPITKPTFRFCKSAAQNRGNHFQNRKVRRHSDSTRRKKWRTANHLAAVLQQTTPRPSVSNGGFRKENRCEPFGNVGLQFNKRRFRTNRHVGIFQKPVYKTIFKSSASATQPDTRTNSSQRDNKTTICLLRKGDKNINRNRG